MTPCTVLVENAALFERRALPILKRMQARDRQLGEEVSRCVVEDHINVVHSLNPITI